MSSPTITEMNDIIAQFDGWQIEYIWQVKTYSKPGELLRYTVNYDSSWDELIPIVEKIEAIYDHFHGYFDVHISWNNCTIQGTKLRTGKNPHYAYFNEVALETKLLATHYAVYMFIIWYNEKIKNNGQ